jgi:hypothetical protein
LQFLQFLVKIHQSTSMAILRHSIPLHFYSAFGTSYYSSLA